MTDRKRIAICGFGVAGGVLAVFLARAGHRVQLIERAPQVGPVGAGFLLQPAGQRVLAQLGLLKSIVARSARIERLQAITDTGRELTNLCYAGVTGGGCAYGVHRGVLFEALHTAALDAGVEVVLDGEIVGVEEESASINVRDAGGRVHGPFDFVAGADGSRSHLRSWLNPNERRGEYEYGALWGSGRSHRPVDMLHQTTRGARRLLGLLPIGDGRCAFFWGVRLGEVDALKARGFSNFREEVSALCPFATEVVDDIGGFHGLKFAGYLHSLPGRIHSNRVVLLGDAAHPMSPHLGQGANLALLDAECLAGCLAELPIPEAFAAYAAARRSHSRYLSLLSRWLSPFFQSDSTVLGWGRDIALPLMCAIPWLRGQMELSVAGVKTGFLDRLQG
jgi:2-polyprenyl-6-methoxyphenol hydroxylase-like FAD-dependent oxidoreductase